MKLHKNWDEIEWGSSLHSRLRTLPPWFYEVLGIVVLCAAIVSGIVWVIKAY